MTEARQESAVDPLVGTKLADKYQIVRQLGEGGMGCVYLGEQSMGASVRKVAIKTLHTHLSHDEKIRARFMRECSIVAELEHPNTIQVFDFGTTSDGTLYIVMEFVSGRSLADVIEQDGPLAPMRAAHVLQQICGSLEEAHKHGIVHRDLKPENIILCEKAGQADWVKVLDFGIAKRSSETDPNEAKLTQQGTVLGTPPYMSPEQFTGKPIDARSDIYSLGIVAYQMLTGDLPFEANTAWEWATQHMTAQPRSFDATPVASFIPAGARDAVMHSLAKDPGARFSTMNEFNASLATGFRGPLDNVQDARTGVRPQRTELAMPVMIGAVAPQPHAPAAAAAHVPAAPANSGAQNERPRGLWLALVAGGLLALGGGYALMRKPAPLNVAPMPSPLSTSSPGPCQAGEPGCAPANPATPAVVDAPLPELGGVAIAPLPPVAAPGRPGKPVKGGKVLTPVPGSTPGAPVPGSTPPALANPFGGGKVVVPTPVKPSTPAVPAMPGLAAPASASRAQYCSMRDRFPAGTDSYNRFDKLCKGAQTSGF